MEQAQEQYKVRLEESILFLNRLQSFHNANGDSITTFYIHGADLQTSYACYIEEDTLLEALDEFGEDNELTTVVVVSVEAEMISHYEQLVFSRSTLLVKKLRIKFTIAEPTQEMLMLQNVITGPIIEPSSGEGNTGSVIVTLASGQSHVYWE